MFLPTACCEQLPHLEAFVSTKLQYLPPTGNRRGCSTQKVLGVNRQHVWMSGSAPLSLIQVRPTSIVSRKSKNTALHFDKVPFFNISQYAWRGSQMTGFPIEVLLTTDQK